jgi:hypothetical protein
MSATAYQTRPADLDLPRDTGRDCDRCIGQALFTVRTDNGHEVRLCGHHTREHLPVILAKGYAFTPLTDPLSDTTLPADLLGILGLSPVI